MAGAAFGLAECSKRACFEQAARPAAVCWSGSGAGHHPPPAATLPLANQQHAAGPAGRLESGLQISMRSPPSVCPSVRQTLGPCGAGPSVDMCGSVAVPVCLPCALVVVFQPPNVLTERAREEEAAAAAHTYTHTQSALQRRQRRRPLLHKHSAGGQLDDGMPPPERLVLDRNGRRRV